MEEKDRSQLSDLLDLVIKKNLTIGETKIVLAILRAVLINGQEGIENNIHTIQTFTGLKKYQVDEALVKLRDKKLLVRKAKNHVGLPKFGSTVVNSSSNNTTSNTTVVPKSGNPLQELLGEIKFYMPHVAYRNQQAYLIEAKNLKYMYLKALRAFPWSAVEEEAMGLIHDYLDYQLETNEWFRTQANLPFTYLNGNFAGYLAKIKPKTRDDFQFQEATGKRLSWKPKTQGWGIAGERYGTRKKKQDAPGYPTR